MARRFQAAGDLGEFMARLGAVSRRSSRLERQDIRRAGLTERAFEAGERREERAERAEVRDIRTGELKEERFKEFEEPILKAGIAKFRRGQARLDQEHTVVDIGSSFGGELNTGTQFFVTKNVPNWRQAVFSGLNPVGMEGGRTEIDDGQGGRRTVTARDLEENPNLQAKSTLFWLTQMSGRKHLQQLAENGDTPEIRQQATNQLKEFEKNPQARLEHELDFKTQMLQQAVQAGLPQEQIPNFMQGIERTQEKLSEITDPKYKLAVKDLKLKIQISEEKIKKLRRENPQQEAFWKYEWKFATDLITKDLTGASQVFNDLLGIAPQEGVTPLDPIRRQMLEKAWKTIDKGHRLIAGGTNGRRGNIQAIATQLLQASPEARATILKDLKTRLPADVYNRLVELTKTTEKKAGKPGVGRQIVDLIKEEAEGLSRIGGEEVSRFAPPTRRAFRGGRKTTRELFEARR